jgi:hypothetical protein
MPSLLRPVEQLEGEVLSGASDPGGQNRLDAIIVGTEASGGTVDSCRSSCTIVQSAWSRVLDALMLGGAFMGSIPSQCRFRGMTG